MTETINHPEYYGGDEPYEVIKVLEAWDLELAKGFCWGSMIKYSARAGKKTANEVEDRLKAEWYANRLATITATLEGRKATADARMERIRAGTEPGFTIATPGSIPEPPRTQALPKVNSHWIWKDPDPRRNNHRCRVQVAEIRNNGVHTRTLAIDGEELPRHSIIKSSFDLDDFFKECTPLEEDQLNPWDEPKVNIWPVPGSEWIWMKEDSEARARVKVTKINKTNGNESVTAKVVTRDRMNKAVIGSEWVNDLDRWHEAVTPLPDWPYSWEKMN